MLDEAFDWLGPEIVLAHAKNRLFWANRLLRRAGSKDLTGRNLRGDWLSTSEALPPKGRTKSSTLADSSSGPSS